MTLFADGEEVVTIRLSLPSFRELIVKDALKEHSYEVLKYSIVGESYNNKDYKDLLKQYRQVATQLEELTYKLRHEQNTTSSNTDTIQ